MRLAACRGVRAVLAILLLATPAAAQEIEDLPIYLRPAYQQAYQAAERWHPVSRAGWYAGVGLDGTSFTTSDPSLGASAGVSAWLGLHLTPQFALELGWSGSMHASRVFQTVTTDVRAYLLRGLRLDVYVQAGFGLYTLDDQLSAGMQGGLGIDYWVGDSITLGTRVLCRVAALSPSGMSDPSASLDAFTIEAGTALHF
jgi:hypothetical protein